MGTIIRTMMKMSRTFLTEDRTMNQQTLPTLKGFTPLPTRNTVYRFRYKNECTRDFQHIVNQIDNESVKEDLLRLSEKMYINQPSKMPVIQNIDYTTNVNIDKYLTLFRLSSIEVNKN